MRSLNYRGRASANIVGEQTRGLFINLSVAKTLGLGASARLDVTVWCHINMPRGDLDMLH